MAKKKKKSSGKRSMGASRGGKKNDALMTGVGIAVGMLGTILLDSKLLATVNGKIKGVGEIAVGGFLAYKAKPALLKGIGYGMAGWGATRTITSLTGMTISGIGCTDMVSGYSQVPAIGGNGVKMFPTPSAVGSSRRERISTLAAGGGM